MNTSKQKITTLETGAADAAGHKKTQPTRSPLGECQKEDKLTSPAKVAQRVFLAGLLACANLAAFPFDSGEQWHQ
jgi:hypothetical protein